LTMKQSEMLRVNTILKQHAYFKPIINNELEAHQIWGADRRGNVKFTGYYAPIIKVSKYKTNEFKYPIYKKPIEWVGTMPSRKEIEVNNVFKGKGLEICYSKNLFDIYTMQLQGSGYIEYPNGKKALLSFDGYNGHPFRSIVTLARKYNLQQSDDLSINELRDLLIKDPATGEKILHENPSYTFFREDEKHVVGAGLVNLTENISIAVDPNYIPIGSIILAKVPIIDIKGRILKHEYKILLAQDTGGVIIGSGHIDLYCGSGSLGKQRASYLQHYGSLWILKPRHQVKVLEAGIY
jgi:membrane-bound lytic murein transglycosylase A